MPDRMPVEREKRGSAPQARPVLAITREGAVWYRCLDDCRLDFGVKSRSQMRRLVESGQVGPDGYTTFEDPIEGVVYEGMDDRDIRDMRRRMQYAAEHRL